MDKQFSHLMSPGNIGDVEIRNRIVSAPMESKFATHDGFVTPRLLSYYTEKAKGGAGLIIVESTYMNQINSQALENQLGLYSRDHGTGMALLATAIHDWGAKCCLQLVYCGTQLSMHERYWSAAPSDGVDDFVGATIPLRGLTKEEISQVIQDFAKAALISKLAGFDMVEVHACHGCLLHMFLSTAYNRRTDEYGGSLENRMRIVIEIVQAIKQTCGPDFPVLVRIVGQERLPETEKQVTLDEAIILAKKLEEMGVEAIDLSGGSNKNQFTVTPTYEQRAVHVNDAYALKKAGIKIPIIVAGGITTPDLAEEVLSQGKSDFIGLGRPLLADPYWGKKIEAGVPEDVVPCIRCTMCVGTVGDFISAKGIRCTTNPRLGLEDIRKVAPLEKKRKVAVIGGGPGGMEAARLATLRGHDVTLYEKRKLGGAMHEASWDMEFKPDIRFLLDYYLTQMKKLKIKVVKEKASVDTIVNGGYDVAIVATGAVGRKFKVPGYNKPHVYTELQVTGGKDKKLGNTVIVVGYGGIAAEIAVSQAMKDKKVIKTQENQVMLPDDIGILIGRSLMEKLEAYNVQTNLGLTLKEITDDGIICVDGNGKSHQFKGDSVVICAGFLPDLTLAEALKGKVKEIYPIGDCVKPRSIGDAIREGWLAANQI